jgi:predicted permease
MSKPKRSAEDFAAEIESHLALEADELKREGLGENEARRRARVEFGSVCAAQERFYLRGRVAWLDNLARDARFALRQLRKNPGFASTAIFTLALGIASSVAIFAFVDAALIKPLPYQDPTRLVQLFESIPLGARFHLSYPDYLDWKRMNKSFSSLDVFAPYGFMQKTSDGLREADGARVSVSFFRTLGVTPILGRDFYLGEDAAAPARTVLLSYSAWQKRYGSSKSVLGQSVTLNDNVYTIIGVLPRDFSFAPAEPADFWAIEKPNGRCEQNRGCHNLFGIARLKPGVTFAAAYDDIKSIALQLQRQYPDQNRDQNAYMLPLTEVIVGDIRPILLTTLCGAGLLLLIASINVASLLLVRAESRKREIAVRGALGASPRRLVRQFVTEGLLLATLGCGLGIIAAREAMHLLATLIPKDMMASMPYLHGLGLNGRVLVFACLLSLFAAALFSLTPLARLRFGRVREGLAESARSSAGVAWRRFGGNLVVVELATATVLFAGAGLLSKSFYRLLHADIGLQPDHIAMVRVNAPPEKYPHDPQQAALGRQVIDTISALPGVMSAGLTTKLPIEDADETSTFQYIGRPNYGEHKEGSIRDVTPGYMTTLRTTLIAGRYFTENDNASSQKVVLINQELARKFFFGENPVGRQIRLDGDKGPPMLIVGVIRDIQEGQLDAAPRGAMYLPFDQNPDDNFTLLVRTRQDEESVLPALQTALRSIDPGMALSDPTTMETKIHDAPSTYLHRSSAWLVGSFAVIALLLGVVGLYGVVAYSVSQRTREIGVRMALGAQRGTVYTMVMRQAGWLTAMGVGMGLVCSVGAALLMRKLLFSVAAWDAPTLAAVALVLAFASLAASFLPARRAAMVDPIEALRAE